MNFSVDTITRDTAIVKVGEYLDYRNAPDFKVMLTNQIDQGTRIFILDFSETKVLDSTGLGSIFSVYHQTVALSGKICFAAVSIGIETVVQVTRSYKVFPQFRTVEAARKAISTPSAQLRSVE